jgi:hypothetical protein
MREVVGHTEQIGPRIGHRRRYCEPIGFQPEILKQIFGIAGAARVQEAEQGPAIFKQMLAKGCGRHMTSDRGLAGRRREGTPIKGAGQSGVWKHRDTP